MPTASAPFPWPGNKSHLTDWIHEQLPAHRTFVDVFGGSGAVLLDNEQPPQTEIYNDADPNLAQFVRTLRDDAEALVDRIEMTPYARDLHNKWASEFFEGHRPDDDIERAARYYFIRRAQYGGEAAKKAGFRATVSGRRNAARQWENSITRLSGFSERLQNVEIRSVDYKKLFSDTTLLNPETVFYCDPPYPDTKDRYQLQDPDEHDHLTRGPTFDFNEFVDAVDALDKSKANPYIIISTDTVPNQLERFNVQSRDESHSMNAQGGAKGITEYLLTNFKPNEELAHRGSNTCLSNF